MRTRGRTTQHLALALLLLALAVPRPSPGASLIAPANLGELALASEAVVLARAGDASVEMRGRLLFTTTRFEVLRVLAGTLLAGDAIPVQTPGGELDGEAWIVPGAPSFEDGAVYLLFLHQKPGGAWLPSALAYGILKEAAGTDGRSLLVPAFEASMMMADAIDIDEEIVPYDARDFLDHLALVLAGRTPFDGGSVSAPPQSVQEGLRLEAPREKAVPAGCAFFDSGGRLYRWRAFDSAGGTATIFADSGGDSSLSGGVFGVVQDALRMWMDIEGTGLNLLYGGRREPSLSCSSGQDSENNLILFDDPCDDIADLQNCGGVLAFGGPRVAGTHRFDGATWLTVVGWIVVVNDGVGCLGSSNYTRMLAHELGHGLGFAHVEDSGALMFGSCCRNVNATDRTCARYAYPPVDPANQRPQVDAGSDRTMRLARDTFRLDATTNDDGRPRATLTTSWTMLDGPGEPIFEDPGDLNTRVTFPRSGSYLLGLTAFDGELYGTDVVEITVETWVGARAVATFRQGSDGYLGVVDTLLTESDPAQVSSSVPALRVDGDSPSGTDQVVQALLRFEDIFGSDAGQVPPGAPILAAWLDLTTTDGGDGASLHRMLASWEDVSSWADFGGNGVQAGDEAEAQADAVVSGQDPTTRVDVARSVSAWSEDPCSNFGWALLPTGGDGWSFSSAEGDDPPALTVEYPLYQPQVLIPIGATWDYFKGRVQPDADWTDPDFSVSAAWLSGPTGIGYGDGDDETVLSDMSRSYLSVFCRHDFQIARPESVGRLTLKIDYDDGFVAYLNGVEVARSSSLNAAGPTVSFNEEAGSHEAGEFEEYLLDRSALVAGTNVLAVQVHNERINSSDLTFIPELSAVFDLIDEGELWRLRRGSEPVPADWNEPDFDDSSWEEVPTGIGYGDGDDETVLSDMPGNYLSIFARRRFHVEDRSAAERRLTVIYDDGIVVYLNGEEIGRAGVSAGAVDASTRAQRSVETEVSAFALPENLLRDGENVLAVSVHNSNVDSTDLSFVPVLSALRGAGRGVFCGEGIVRGDANDDGGVDIGDAVRILFFLFRGEEGLCEDAADVDDNGALESADAVSLLSFLFLSGAAPAAPGVDCGIDPTDDAFPECVSSSCRS